MVFCECCCLNSHLHESLYLFVINIRSYFIFWKVIKKENGLTYITGRGCGTLTPIKHFDSMPTDISELTCAIINSEKIKKSDGKIFGTEHCQFVNNEIGGNSYEQILVLKLETPSETL